MKIKHGDWLIDSRTLFNVEWKKFYPTINVHEKYQSKIKWVIRTFTFLGIATSILTLPWFLGLLLAIVLLGVDYLLENIIFLYTTIVFQSPPDFEIKHGIWKSNMFLFPQYEGDLPIFCMGFTDKEYAINLFNYFLSWNQLEHNDQDDIVTVNWKIDKEGGYETRIFANPRRKNLDKIFQEMGEVSKYEKYGKRQQQFIAQFIFGQRFKSSEMMVKFTQQYKPGDQYYFAPALVSENGRELVELLTSHAILKTAYNLSKSG